MLLRRSFVQQGGEPGHCAPIGWSSPAWFMPDCFFMPPRKKPPLMLSGGQTVKEPRSLSPPQRRKKVQSFSSATCAAKKILLRLQVWNLCAAGAQIMRAADCTPPCQKAAAPVGAAALTFFCSVNWRAAAPRGAQAAAATAAAAKTRPPSPRRCPDAAAACRRRTRANSNRR